MKRQYALPLAAVLLACALPACNPGAGPGAPPALTTAAATDTLCADPTRAMELCSAIPHEVQVSLPFGYTGLTATVQPAFDQFSWQSFVALNWPAGADGKPLPGPIGANPGSPRVWETYEDAADVFWPGTTAAACNTGGGKLLLQMAKNGHVIDPDGSFDEAVGGPLVDRNLNFVVFEKKMNPDEAAYVRANRLQDPQVQDTFSVISFPAGRYANQDSLSGGRVGAMEIKAAWRILQPAAGDDTTRYYRRAATIYVPAKHSATGQPLCVNAVVGLVGLHIAHKTEDFPQWIWSTFEHVDNAPTCPAGSTNCGQDGRRYSFYNPQCPTCPVNTPLALPAGDSTFRWAATPPYAARYAYSGRYGSQITRTQPVYDFTEAVNTRWHAALAGTVWAHYRLIGSQWLTGTDSPGTAVSAPETLGNSVLESYIPNTSSCVGCHQGATTVNGKTSADFSFLLEMAGKAPTALPPPDGDAVHIGHAPRR
jgi:hypothetical protein